MTSRLPVELVQQLQALAGRLGRLAKPVHAWLAGGWAVYYHTEHRMSGSVDISWSRRVPIPRDLQAFEISEAGRADGSLVVVMDGNFNDVLGSFPPDWEARSAEIARFGDMILHVMDPVDLAVSKVGRFTEQDAADIRELARVGLIDPKIFRRRAEEALDYYVGDLTFVRYNLRDSIEIVTEASPAWMHRTSAPAQGGDVTDEISMTDRLHGAARRGDAAGITELVAQGADVNARSKDGDTALHVAARPNTDPTAIRALIELGADPGARDKDGMTALHHACNRELTSAEAAPRAVGSITALVEAGADVDARDNQAETPLHRAASRPFPEVAAHLVGLGADVNAGDMFARTPLHTASRDNRDPEMITTLIHLGADVHARDSGGNVPLHEAFRDKNSPAVVVRLIELGADPEIEDSWGRTPLHWASDWLSIRDDDSYIQAIRAGLEAGARAADLTTAAPPATEPDSSSTPSM